MNKIKIHDKLNLYSVYENNKQGIIDNNGNIILPVEYEDIVIFDSYKDYIYTEKKINEDYFIIIYDSKTFKQLFKEEYSPSLCDNISDILKKLSYS